MIKLIACDLDETLLNKAKEISDEDVAAIAAYFRHCVEDCGAGSDGLFQ